MFDLTASMTRRRAILTIPGGATLAALAVTQTGCTGDAIIADLQAGLDIITGFLPQISTLAGLPADLSTLVQNYLTAINSALGNASTILLGAGTDAEKATQILASFAGIVAPLIPAPFSAVAQIVVGLATAVAKFLSSLPLPAPVAGKLGVSATSAHVWTGRQQDRLRTARIVASANATALAKSPHQ